MATERDYQNLLSEIGALRQLLVNRLGPQLVQNPHLGEVILKHVDDRLAAVLRSEDAAPPPPDQGLAQLIGLGPDAAGELGATRVVAAVEPYEESVTPERVVAAADLYYIYQHERIGVFRAIQRLKQLFEAGTLRLSGGPGAYALYQFDRKEVLRYTERDRHAAYRRIFGYGATPVPAGARPNPDFHRLFTHFMNEVALFWRDKRISDVIRERAQDPSFGSIATVRRAGLDLRNNLKWASYGHLNVLRVEVMQVLDAAFRIAGAEDIRRVFGVETAWDVIEEVLSRYLNERPVASPRQRMAVTGREVLRWIGQSHVLETQRPQFEALLLEIAEDAEEWLTSAQALGVARRHGGRQVLPWDHPPSVTSNGRRPPAGSATQAR